MTAVLLSRRDPRGIGELLEAVLGQALPPDDVVVIDRTDAGAAPRETPTVGPVPSAPPATDGSVEAHDDSPGAGDTDEDSPDPAGDSDDDAPDLAEGSGPAAGLAAIVEAVASTRRIPVSVTTADPAAPVRAAVRDVVSEREPDAEAHGESLLWIIPVGAVPERQALVRLVDEWRRSPSAGLIGPKHVDAGNPQMLRALSIRTTRGGRLSSRPRPGEPDQGQYDRSTDVLAVPLAGSLIERSLLLELGGWESFFGDVGADLDLGWRAHIAGRRVVVVPGARMLTERGVAPVGGTSPARRRAARRVALARAPWWAAPFLAVWILLTSFLAALGLLLLKRPRAAWAELTALVSVDPFRGALARRRTRQPREVRRRDLRVLFQPRSAVLTSWGDAVHDAVVSPRAPIGDQANELNPRSWAADVLRHPGVLATAGATAVAVAAGRSLGWDVLTGAGSGLSGGELVGNRASASALWHAWTDGWTGAGLGGTDPAGPHTVLLAGPAWLVDHLPLLPDPSSPAGLVLALILLFGMPLAAASAYLALRPVATTRWVRGLAAFAWACTGVAAASVAQGRLGAVVALVLLPAIASGTWAIATRRSTATTVFATSLAAVVLGAFVPVLLGVVAVIALVLAVLRRGARAHALTLAVLPVALLGPWLVRSAESSCTVLLAGVGLGQWGGSAPEPWRLALLDPGGAGSSLVWTSLPLVVVGVLALARGRSWRAAQLSLGLLLPLFLAAALVSPSVRLGTVPPGVPGAGEPITLWPGTFLLPLALVLVLSLARGLDGIPLRGAAGDAEPQSSASRAGGRLASSARWTAVVASCGAVLVGAVGVVAATLGTDLAPWRDPRPAVSIDQAEGAFATRALFVSPGDQGAGYQFIGREAAALVRPLPAVAESDGSLAPVVSGLLADVTSGSAVFADTATDLLAIREGVVPELARRLDSTAGLQRIAPRDGWQMWRISPAGAGSTQVDLVAPPRLRLETPDGTRLVTTTGMHAGTDTTITVPTDSRLVVAEPNQWSRHAVVAADGVVLEPVGETATPTYAMPEGNTSLEVTVIDPVRWWHAAQLAGFLLLAFLAVPFGRRESRVRRP